MKTNDLYIAKEIDKDNLPEGEVIAISEHGHKLYGVLRRLGSVVVCVSKFESLAYITHYLAPVTLAELKLMKEEGE